MLPTIDLLHTWNSFSLFSTSRQSSLFRRAAVSSWLTNSSFAKEAASQSLRLSQVCSPGQSNQKDTTQGTVSQLASAKSVRPTTKHGDRLTNPSMAWGAHEGLGESWLPWLTICRQWLSRCEGDERSGIPTHKNLGMSQLNQANLRSTGPGNALPHTPLFCDSLCFLHLTVAGQLHLAYSLFQLFRPCRELCPLGLVHLRQTTSVEPRRTKQVFG